MNSFNTIDYYESFERNIRISDTECLFLKRLEDNTVNISYADSLTGTLTNLASYKNGRWSGYNPPNFNKLFDLFRKNKNLKPALIRFLTPGQYTYEISKIEKVIVCFRKRFYITVWKTKKNINLEFIEKKNKNI